MSHFTCVTTRMVCDTCLPVAQTTPVPTSPNGVDGCNRRSHKATVAIADLTQCYGKRLRWEVSHGRFLSMAYLSELAIPGARIDHSPNEDSHLYGVGVTKSTMPLQGFTLVKRTSTMDSCTYGFVR